MQIEKERHLNEPNFWTCQSFYCFIVSPSVLGTVALFAKIRVHAVCMFCVCSSMLLVFFIQFYYELPFAWTKTILNSFHSFTLIFCMQDSVKMVEYNNMAFNVVKVTFTFICSHRWSSYTAGPWWRLLGDFLGTTSVKHGSNLASDNMTYDASFVIFTLQRCFNVQRGLLLFIGSVIKLKCACWVCVKCNLTFPAELILQIKAYMWVNIFTLKNWGNKRQLNPSGFLFVIESYMCIMQYLKTLACNISLLKVMWTVSHWWLFELFMGFQR